jgi:hypothetical protein
MHQPTDAENNWRPDLSRERPEWKTAHAAQRDANLDIDKDGVYVVKDGDTLSDIARRSLKQQNAATDVATVNQEIAKIVEHNVDAYPGLQHNPHLIHPGDQLRLGIHSDANATLEVPPLAAAAPTDKAADAPLPAPTPTVAQTDADLSGTAPVVASQPDAPPIVPPVAPPPLVPLQGDPGAAPPPYPGAVQLNTAGAGYSSDQPNYTDVPLSGGVAYAPGAASYQSMAGGDYTDQEAARLSQLIANDPHAAANEMREQIQQLDPQTAGVLIGKTKDDELVGGLGDLQIQVEFDQTGRDSGYRNVTIATPDGIEEIAEIQAQPHGFNNADPLGFVAGVIVGDLAWQQRRGINFNDDQYRGWCNREQGRENYWYSNNDQFVQNWQNPNYRSSFQNQKWQIVANNPTVNNTYITNNRYDTTIINRPVNTTIINETINQTNKITNNPHPRPVSVAPGQLHRSTSAPSQVVSGQPERKAPPVEPTPIAGTPRPETAVAKAPDAEAARAKIQHDADLARQQAATAKAQHDAEVAREQAATAKAQHDAEVAREQAATAKAQHDAEVARQQAATAKAQHDAEVARQQAATAKAQHDAEVAREQAATAKAQHDAEVARQQAATAKAQHDAEVARQQAATAKAQHDAEVARQQAATAKAQHDAEVAREQAATAKAQHDAEVAREQAAAAAAVKPLPPKKS